MRRQLAQEAPDLRDLERLIQRQRRQDAGQAASQHGLARAGRPAHEHVMAACGRQLERSLGFFLAMDL